MENCFSPCPRREQPFSRQMFREKLLFPAQPRRLSNFLNEQLLFPARPVKSSFRNNLLKKNCLAGLATSRNSICRTILQRKTGNPGKAGARKAIYPSNLKDKFLFPGHSVPGINFPTNIYRTTIFPGAAGSEKTVSPEKILGQNKQLSYQILQKN